LFRPLIRVAFQETRRRPRELMGGSSTSSLLEDVAFFY
jgi:hypothetical protein